MSSDLIENAIKFMRHDGLCGIVGGYGYCTCGMGEARDELERLSTPTDVADRYFITKGGAYYRPNAEGYTRDAAEAGRFTLDEAISHSHPNGPDGPRDGIDYVPVPKATDVADRREAIARIIVENCGGAMMLLPKQAEKAAVAIASLIEGPLPEGFVAVPVEPTEAMCDAAVFAAKRLVSVHDGEPHIAANVGDHVWRLMLAARPTGES